VLKRKKKSSNGGWLFF